MPLANITQLEPFNINTSASFSFANITSSGNITASYLIGNGSQLTGLPASYANSDVAAYLPTYTGNFTAGNANISGTLTVGSFTTAGTTGNISGANYITANYFVGDGSLLTGLPASYANSNVATYLPTYSGVVGGTLSTTAQPNISSVGTLSSLTVSGLVTATSGGIKVGNLQDTSGTNTIQLTNSDIIVTGNISAGGGGTGNVTATYFIGNGSQLTGLPATYSNTNVAAYLPTYTGNFTAGNANISGALTVGTITTAGSPGNITGANYVVANFFSGDGSLLDNIVAGNIDGQVSNSLVAGTVYTNAQPNITSVGTLADLSVSGNATVTGNLTVGGNVNYINVDTLVIEDPIIEQGNGPNNTPLTTNDGKDRGSLLHYYTTEVVDAFMGWDNSNGEFAFGSNVSVSSEVVTFNTLGNVRAGYYLGNGSQLTGVAATTATTAGTVTTAAQPNITSVGTLADLTVTGNITGAYLIGNGSQLTGLPASYANSNVAAYLPTYTGNFTAGNANISGTLTVGSFTTAGATGNISGANYITANYFVGNGSQLTGLPASYANSNVETYLPTYTGNLSPGNLTVGTSANLGAVGNVIITGGSSGQVLSTDGAGTLSWTDQTGGGGSLPASPIAKVDVFTADGSGNTYTLSSTPANEDQLSVNIDGVMQLHSSFSLSGNVVTLGGTPVNGAKIEITNIASNIGATTGKAIAMAIVFGF